MKKIRLAKSLGSMFLAGVLTVSCLGCGNTAQNQETTPEAVPAESVVKETADTSKSEGTAAAGEEDQTPVEITIGGWADKDTNPEEYEDYGEGGYLGLQCGYLPAQGSGQSASGSF